MHKPEEPYDLNISVTQALALTLLMSHGKVPSASKELGHCLQTLDFFRSLVNSGMFDVSEMIKEADKLIHDLDQSTIVSEGVNNERHD